MGERRVRTRRKDKKVVVAKADGGSSKGFKEQNHVADCDQTAASVVAKEKSWWRNGRKFVIKPCADGAC